MHKDCRASGDRTQDRPWPPGPGDPLYEGGVPMGPTIPLDHPYRRELLDDADLFWHWLPTRWGGSRAVSRREIVEFFNEIADLRQQLAELSRGAGR